MFIDEQGYMCDGWRYVCDGLRYVCDGQQYVCDGGRGWWLECCLLSWGVSNILLITY